MALRGDFAGRALLVLLGCTVCQLGAGLFYGTRTLAPDVIEELGWTRAMWSSAMAPMIFVSSVSQAFVGAACGRFGVRPVLAAAILLLGATFVILANLEALWHFHLAMTLLALGNAGIGDVSIGAVVTRWFQRARGVALGVAMVGSNLGAVVFVHLLALLSETGSWRDAALQVGLGSVAFILPIALLAIREPGPGEGAAAEPLDPEGAPEPVAVRPSEALRRPAFWLFFFTLFAYALAQLGVTDHLILHLMDRGYTKREAAGALELALGAGIAAKLGAGLVALRLTPRTALVLNTTLLAGSFLLLPFADRPGLLALFGVLFGVSTAARDVLLPLLVAEVFGVRYFAQIYGFVMLAFFPGGGLGPMALGALHDALGSYALGFTVVWLLLIVALVGQLRIRVPTRQRSAPAADA